MLSLSQWPLGPCVLVVASPPTTNSSLACQYPPRHHQSKIILEYAKIPTLLPQTMPRSKAATVGQTCERK